MLTTTIAADLLTLAVVAGLFALLWPVIERMLSLLRRCVR